MNRNNLKWASLVLFFATSAAIGMRPLDPNISAYVINKAAGLGGKQYTITIQAEPDVMHAQIGKFGNQFEEKTVPFNQSVYVGQLKQIATIKTSGDYASGWTSNTGILNEIKQEAVKMGYEHVDVYLHVVPSKTGYYINSWHWNENETNKPSAIISFDDLPTQLQNIIHGAWGADYAKKVMDICGADYTKTQKLGLVNLCHHLTQTIEPLFGKISKTSGANTFEIETTKDEIMETINRIHRKFEEWKAQGKI